MTTSEPVTAWSLSSVVDVVVVMVLVEVEVASLEVDVSGASCPPGEPLSGSFESGDRSRGVKIPVGPSCCCCSNFASSDETADSAFSFNVPLLSVKPFDSLFGSFWIAGGVWSDCFRDGGEGEEVEEEEVWSEDIPTESLSCEGAEPSPSSDWLGTPFSDAIFI